MSAAFHGSRVVKLHIWSSVLRSSNSILFAFSIDH